MKRRDFIRSVAGVSAGLFAVGGKLLAAVRPTLEVSELGAIGTEVGTITAGQIAATTITSSKPKGELVGRYVLFSDGSVSMIVHDDGRGDITLDCWGRQPGSSDSFVLLPEPMIERCVLIADDPYEPTTHDVRAATLKWYEENLKSLEMAQR